MTARRIIVEHQLLRAERGQFRQVRQRRLDLIRVDDDADVRQQRSGFAEFDADRFGGCCGSRHFPVAGHTQTDRLVQSLAGRQHIGPWQRKRPDIGLVGGVRPVALVLHLERIAFHPAFGGNAGPDLMGDRPQILERLPRVDQVGKLCFHHAAVGVLDRDRAAGQAGDRMQDAEAAAIGLESAFGEGAHVENQLAVSATLDCRAKVESAFPRSDTTCRIADGESVGALADD